MSKIARRSPLLALLVGLMAAPALAANVSGHVEGLVREDSSGICGGPEVWRPFPFLHVTFDELGAAPVASDADGAFDVDLSQVPSSYTARLEGVHTDVQPGGIPPTPTEAIVQSSVDPTQPGASITIRWDNANSHSDERMAYYHFQRARDYALSIDNTGLLSDLPEPLPVVLSGGCPLGLAEDTGLLLCHAGIKISQGTGYPIQPLSYVGMGPTAQAPSVLYHEFGHYINAITGTESEELTETGADIFALLATGDPLWARVFPGRCGQWAVRRFDNLLDFRFDGSGRYHAAQVGAGVIWDAWKELEPTPTPGSSANRDLADLWLRGSALLGQSSEELTLPNLFGTMLEAKAGSGSELELAVCAAARRHGIEPPAAASECPPPSAPLGPPTPAAGVSLVGQLVPDDFSLTGVPSAVVGYVSPAGREYALLGLVSGVAVVELPAAPGPPEIVAEKALGNSSGARSIAILGTHAFVVAEGGSEGLVVLDLSAIDTTGPDRVTHLGSHSGAFQRARSIRVDPATSKAYVVGADTGSVVAVDLSAPDQPLAAWSGAAGRSLELMTYASGTRAGFLFTGGDAVVVLDLDKLDADDPMQDPPEIAQISLPGLLRQAHHGWLDPERRILFFGDLGDELYANQDYFDAHGTMGELEGQNIVSPSTVFAVDVSNPQTPGAVSGFTPGFVLRDVAFDGIGRHLFVAGSLGGLRILDTGASAPVGAIDELGFFATFPSYPHSLPLVDAAMSIGARSVYADLPSGRVLVSDTLRGLFVLDPSAAVLSIAAISPVLSSGSEAFSVEGAGFAAGTRVFVGDVEVTASVTVHDSRHLTGTLPATLTGLADLRIENPDATAEVRGAFAPPSPCDLDADGSLDVVDVLLGSRIVRGELEPGPAQVANGDVAPPGAPDGSFGVADLLLLVRSAFGAPVAACGG